MLENSNFNQNLIDKIREEKIVPKAKWRFLLKNSLIWALGIFSLLLGGAAASLIYYVSKNENGFSYRRAGGGLMESLFLVIPIFWIICLILFISSVYYYVKHTRKGYKYSNWQITIMVAAIVVFIGAMSSVSSLSAKMEDIMSQKAPYYDTLVNPGLNFWSQAEEGRLTGMVVEKISPDKYLLEDKSRNEWTVVKTIETDDELEDGRFVRLIGEKSGDYEFTVQEVLPMGPGQGFLKRPHVGPVGCQLDRERPCEAHTLRREKKDKIYETSEEEIKNKIDDKEYINPVNKIDIIDKIEETETETDTTDNINKKESSD